MIEILLLLQAIIIITFVCSVIFGTVLAVYVFATIDTELLRTSKKNPDKLYSRWVLIPIFLSIVVLWPLLLFVATKPDRP